MGVDVGRFIRENEWLFRVELSREDLEALAEAFSGVSNTVDVAFLVRSRGCLTCSPAMEIARALEEAGVFSIVLELIPAEVAKIITEEVSIPTIGIGAGPYCDGQVLVIHDILGLFERFVPKFVKRYTNLSDEIRKAISEYIADVKEKRFPEKEHSFFMSEDEYKELLKRLGRS